MAMRYIVEHPDWGFFLGVVNPPQGEQRLIWSNRTGGFRGSTVVSFQGIDHMTDFFLNRLSPHELSRVLAHATTDKEYLNIVDLSKMGLIGKSTEGLLYNEPPIGCS